MLQKLKSNAFLLVIALPLLGMLNMLARYGVNVPYADHWALVPLFTKIDNGTLGFHDLWAQHNEHRILFPKIVSLVLARLTHWYTPVEILFSVIMATITIVVLGLMLNSTIKSQKQRLSALFLISFWFFSPIQWQNWLWGWQIEWFMCITSVIGVFYFLDRLSVVKKAKYLWGAIGLATIATYSLGSGIFIWPIGLALLVAYDWLKLVPKKPIKLWAFFGVLEIFLYYFKYHKPPDSPSPDLLFHYPGSFLDFFITTLGRPVTSHYLVAYLFGIIMISLIISITILTIYLVPKKKLQPVLKWYAIIIFSLTALFFTSVARLGLGIAGAMGSRYTAFSLLIIISMTAIIFYLANITKIKKASTNIVIIIVFIFSLPLILQSYSAGLSEMREQSKLLADIKKCTSIEYPTDKCLLATFPLSADVAREWLEYLKNKNYAGY